MKGVARQTNTDADAAEIDGASPTLDIFLREDPRFDSLDLPTTIVVFEGCLVREFNTISRGNFFFC